MQMKFRDTKMSHTTGQPSSIPMKTEKKQAQESKVKKQMRLNRRIGTKIMQFGATWRLLAK
jgi:hypothetical protein